MTTRRWIGGILRIVLQPVDLKELTEPFLKKLVAQINDEVFLGTFQWDRYPSGDIKISACTYDVRLFRN
jgi:hypothetical protein